MTNDPISLTSLIYDVGMHKGEDSAFYLALGYSVVAVEANPDLAGECRVRFKSEIADGRLTLVEGALAPGDETHVPFFVHPNSVWGTTQASWATRNETEAASTATTARRIDFAELVRGHGIPHYLKIDIEGVDSLCLEELLGFERRPKFVSVELEQRVWSTLLRQFDLLQQLGYNSFAVVQQGTIPGSALEIRTQDNNVRRYRFEADSSGPFGDAIGPWMSRVDAIKRCHRLFMAYRLLGHDSLVRRTRLGRGLRGQANRLTGFPLPGWHDLHARRVVRG